MKRQKLFQQLNNNFLSIQNKQIPQQQKQFNYNQYFNYQLESFAKFESLLNYKNDLYEAFKRQYASNYKVNTNEYEKYFQDEISDYFKPAQPSKPDFSTQNDYSEDTQSTEQEIFEQEITELNNALENELGQLYNNSDDYSKNDNQQSEEQSHSSVKQKYQEQSNENVNTSSSQTLEEAQEETLCENNANEQNHLTKTKQKRKEKRRKELTDQECYQKFSEFLNQEISDFDASYDDAEYKREKKIDYSAGKLICNNVWTNQQIQILKAYIYYVQNINGRLHFGPLVHLVKKSKKQIWKKYNQLYTIAFTEEEIEKLVQLVQQHMKENCYVDFAQIAGTLGKNVLNSIHQYCMYMEMHWDPSFDQKIIEHLKLQVMSPPFYGLIAYELGLYETVIKKRAERLGVFQPKKWTDEEDRLLQHFWANRENKKEAKKADILDVLPTRFIFDIRKRLIKLGLDVNRVLWV